MTKTNDNNFSPLCRKDCKICTSGYVEKINSMRQSEFLKYEEILEKIKSLYGLKLSKSSLSRHFQNFKKNLIASTNEKLLSDFNEIGDELVRNQKQAEQLANSIYNNLLSRINSGSLDFEVSDWEKIVKLRHQVLTGRTGAMDDLFHIFERASIKFGVPLSQPSLPLSPISDTPMTPPVADTPEELIKNDGRK